MNLILFSILEALAVLTLMTIKGAVKNSGLADRNSFLFILLAISSIWWTMCFGSILMCDNFGMAYMFRTVGMIGTFAYLISGTILIASWTDIKRKWRRVIVGFSFLGILIYPLSVQEELIVFERTSIGTTYTFLPSFETNLYTAYSVIIALLMYVMLIWMLKSTDKKRKKVMGKRVLGGLTVVAMGMLFDTILPLFGLPAVPTSTMGQAICVLLMYRALAYDKRNQIDIGNIAAYIDRSCEVYVFAYDEKLTLRMASESATEFMQLGQDRLYKVNELFDLPEDFFRFEEESKTADVKCIRNGVECNIGIEKIPDEFGDLIGYAVSVTDITDKIKYIREIEEAKKQADSANESKSAFLANMSHEIRTPLSAVLGMDEMILRETDINEIYKYAEDIQNAGKSLLAIIEDILDFSKIESGKMSIVEGNYNVAQAMRLLYSIVIFKAQKKGIELKFDIDENIPCELCGDELRIRQIMLNLINNAIKYTKVGWVKIKLAHKNIDNDNIELILTVEDTGIGIKKEEMPKLFNKFQRLDERNNHNVEGTGLGLSIVGNLVGMMNGHVDVKSVYQRGSIFTVTIPQKVVNHNTVGKFSMEQQNQVKVAREGFRAPEARILAVDDNQINLTIVKGLLRRTDIKVDVAPNGYDCLDMVKENRYDIILLDHMMPDIDGVEVLKRLKNMSANLSKDAAVIALTANALAGAREEYMKYGFDDYISKPIEPKELEDTIKRYLPKELIVN